MSEEAAATVPGAPAPSTAPAPAAHLTDFSDRLSPMLVKELRQGMRTNLFTVAFILLQAFMVLCVLLGSMSPGSGGDGAVSGFFWFFVIVALLVAMPIRGFSALTSEISLNTMDLIQLTQLGAWRITFGKWAALVSQSLLLVCGILPYLVMRYFFGGVDLFDELWKLLAVVLASMLLTAVTVGFSAFRSVLLRAAVIIGLMICTFNLSLFTLVGGPGGLGFRSVMFSSISTSNFWWGVIGVLATWAYAIFFLLDLGASRIAPVAENHATRKRVGALAFVILIMMLPFTGVDYEFAAVLSAIVIGVVCVDAMTERPALVPSVLRPFVVTRPWSRPFMPILTPGWHTGIFFFLVIFLVWMGFLFIHDASQFREGEFVLVMVSAAGTLVFPLLIIHLFMKNIADTPSAFPIYVLIQICTGAIALFLVAVENAIGEIAYFIFPIPNVILFAAMNNDDSGFLFLCALVGLALGVAIPLWRSIPLSKATRNITRQLRETRKAEFS